MDITGLIQLLSFISENTDICVGLKSKWGVGGRQNSHLPLPPTPALPQICKSSCLKRSTGGENPNVLQRRRGEHSDARVHSEGVSTVTLVCTVTPVSTVTLVSTVMPVCTVMLVCTVKLYLSIQCSRKQRTCRILTQATLTVVFYLYSKKYFLAATTKLPPDCNFALFTR